MSKLILGDLECDCPETWGIQGMITCTIPSTDRSVRPNIIITKEILNEEVDLNTYFNKIKDAVKSRGIQSFKVLNEAQILIGGMPGMQMVCEWDLAAMKQMLPPEEAQALQNVKTGQKVRQIQVTLLRGKTAINITASFPGDQFEIYSRPFQKFLQGIRFTQ